MKTPEILIGIGAGLFLSGCISYTTTYGEKPTQKRFENAEAAQIFYEGEFVRKERIDEDGKGSRTLSIGLGLPVSIFSRETGQKRVNNAFREADLNDNGMVSVQEAQSFAASKNNSGTK